MSVCGCVRVWCIAKSGADLEQSWMETPTEFANRMHEDIRAINMECDVAGLCHEFPQRLQDLASKTMGDRLRK